MKFDPESCKHGARQGMKMESLHILGISNFNFPHTLNEVELHLNEAIFEFQQTLSV